MRSNDDFYREIEAHIGIEADRLRSEGMSAAEAEAAARRAFGNITGAKERFYESRRWMFFENLLRDCRYALRSLCHSPALSAAAVLSLALGIGANTAIFSLIDAVILRMLPVKAPEQLYEFGQSFSTFEYRAFLGHNPSFIGIIASGGGDPRDVAIGDSTSERLNLAVVSGNYFPVLGVDPAAGRLLVPSDDAAGAPPVAVLNYDCWKKRFGLDPSAIGAHIRVGTGVFTVVGAAAKGFFGEEVGASPDMWIPVQTAGFAYPGQDLLNAKNVHWLRLIGRLRLDVRPVKAAGPFTAMKHQMDIDRAGAAATPEFIDETMRESIQLKSAGKGRSQIGPAAIQTLWVLFAVSVLVLLVACMNVANLLLARAGARQREIFIRRSLGAGRARLIRQLMTESIMLAFFGGAVGLGLALPLSRWLLRLGSDSGDPVALRLGPDLRMLGFTFGISLLSGLLFGLAPAWRGSRSDPDFSAGGNRQSKAIRSRLGPALVGAQVSVSLAILMAAGLLIRTLENLRAVDTGLTPERLLVADVDPKTADYKGAALAELCEKLSNRLSHVPGVNSVTFSGNGLFTGRNANSWIRVDDQPRRSAKHDTAFFDVVGPGYFSTLGISLIRGRDFDAHDRLPGKQVAIVNEDFVKHWLPGADPIGHRIIAGDTQMEIIGVARDVRDRNLRDRVRRYFYTPLYQLTDPNLFSVRFMVRTAADPVRVASLIRQAIRAEDKTLRTVSIDTASDLLNRTLAQERLVATLSGWFSALALALAAVGLYGLMAYRVVRRTSEIGVRMALGAQRGSVLAMVLRESLVLVIAGVAVGLPLGLAGCRELKSLLYGLTTTDVPTMLIASVGMIAVGLLAAAIPARRASRIDPIQALRYE